MCIFEFPLKYFYSVFVIKIVSPGHNYDNLVIIFEEYLNKRTERETDRQINIQRERERERQTDR